MANNTITWGIVGTGTISTSFAKDFAFVKQAKLRAVTSRRLDRAKAFARTHAIPKAYDSLDAMLADPDVQAVYIGTPHSDHFAAAAKALQAGKAVLCEKPLTVSGKETAALIKISQETGVYLMEALWTYFLPAIKQAKAWVAAGRIGEIIAVKADFGYPMDYDPNSRLFNPDLAGGALLDMGIYPVALAWLFTGAHPVTIQSTAHFAPTGVDDDVSWLFTYQNGATASLGCSFRGRLGNRAVIVGTRGRIEIPDFFRASTCYLYAQDDLIDSFDCPRTSIGLAYETQAMVDDLLAGRDQSTVMPHTASKAFADHMDQIKASWSAPA